MPWPPRRIFPAGGTGLPRARPRCGRIGTGPPVTTMSCSETSVPGSTRPWLAFVRMWPIPVSGGSSSGRMWWGTCARSAPGTGVPMARSPANGSAKALGSLGASWFLLGRSLTRSSLPCQQAWSRRRRPLGRGAANRGLYSVRSRSQLGSNRSLSSITRFSARDFSAATPTATLQSPSTAVARGCLPVRMASRKAWMMLGSEPP
jgi:hypothetical protein